MGGNALKETVTRRYNRDEYYTAVAYIKALFMQELPDLRVEDVKAYREKDTFGDIDMLVQKDNHAKERVRDMLEEAGVKEFVYNGDVWSVGWGDIQLDLIFQPLETFHFALNYFNWNDLGNLLGRIAHKMGFKLCFDGLKYVMRDGDYKVGELVVTTNFYAALDFLGYDYERFREGFGTLEEIFMYVASGDHFIKDAYPLEHRSHKARTRDAKRLSYQKMLGWVEETQPEDGFCPPDPPSDLGQAFYVFPDFHKTYEKMKKDYKISLTAAQKFNGKIVKAMVDLEGKELGSFIKFLRTYDCFSVQSVLELRQHEILENIKGLYYVWRN